MISHPRRPASAVAGVALVATILGGCSKEEPPVVAAPPPRPAKPAPAPAPAITPVSQLMADLRIDERVMLPEELAPDNNADRKAVLEFFDAFVRGDRVTLGGLLTLADRTELDSLVEKGIWDEQVELIEAVELRTGDSDYGPCVLAIFTTDLDFQPQLWYYQGDESGYTFEAAPSPPHILDRMSGTDLIQAWHDVWAAELARADDPDQDLDVQQVNLEEEEGSGLPSAGGPQGPGDAPPSGPRNPGRRPPRKNPRKPPGAR